jgi:hypothetical protein
MAGWARIASGAFRPRASSDSVKRAWIAWWQMWCTSTVPLRAPPWRA